MNSATTHISCGIHQAYGLRDDFWGVTPVASAEANAVDLLQAVINQPTAMMIWSDSVGSRRTNKPKGPGVELAEYLTKQNIGTVHAIGPRRNPNSGNQIMLWVFEPRSVAAVRSWLSRQRGERAVRS